MKRSVLLQWIVVVMALSGTVGARDLAIGDAVEMTVRGVPPAEHARIFGVYKIAEDGKLHLPLIRPISAAGLTPGKLGQLAERSYKEAGIYANPTVELTKESSCGPLALPIVVGGHVRKPGPVELSPLALIGQAIAAAGGKKEGYVGVVQVIRKGKLYSIDLRTAAGVAFLLEAGDTIIVDDSNTAGSD